MLGSEFECVRIVGSQGWQETKFIYLRLMQTKFYFLLLLLMPVLGQSQTPVPFPTQDASWLYGLYDDFGNQYWSYIFYLDGDSSLGETWSVLHNGGGIEGLIRQDSSLKVWIVPNGLTTPELLYDFGAVVGDTLKSIRTGSAFGNGLDTLVVTEVLVYGGGYPTEWRLRSIQSQGWGAEFGWTEGVGDQSWLPASGPINMVSGTTYLNCFSNMAYNAAGNPCVVANEEALSQHLDVYPNPSTGKFRLDFNQPMELGGMKVMDMHGRTVRTYDEFQGTLDLMGMEAGIYLLSLEVGEKQMVTRKLLLQ